MTSKNHLNSWRLRACLLGFAAAMTFSSLAHASTYWNAGRLPDPANVDVCFLVPADHATGPTGSAVQALITNIDLALAEYEAVSSLRFNIKNPKASGWRTVSDSEFGNAFETSCSTANGIVSKSEEIRIYVRDRNYTITLPPGTAASDFDLTDPNDPVILAAGLTNPGCTKIKRDDAGSARWDHANEKYFDPTYNATTDTYQFPRGSAYAWNGSPSSDSTGNPGCWYNTHIPQAADMDTILHELGHAIGLSHEMQRWDSPGECANVPYRCPGGGPAIFLAKLCDGTADCAGGEDEEAGFCDARLKSVPFAITKYDVKSIMHYKGAAAGDSGTCPPKTATLTDHDKVGVQYMYPIDEAGWEVLAAYWQRGDNPVVFRLGWNYRAGGDTLGREITMAPQAFKNNSIRMLVDYGDIVDEFYYDEFVEGVYPIFPADFAPPGLISVTWTFTDLLGRQRDVNYSGVWPDESFLWRSYDYSL